MKNRLLFFFFNKEVILKIFWPVHFHRKANGCYPQPNGDKMKSEWEGSLLVTQIHRGAETGKSEVRVKGQGRANAGSLLSLCPESGTGAGLGLGAILHRGEQRARPAWAHPEFCLICFYMPHHWLNSWLGMGKLSGVT